MKLTLDFPINPLEIKLEHGDRCILLGSCFSNEISSHLQESGFDVLSNPFGTIFHPEPISRMISETISGLNEERILQRKDLFFSWDSAGTIFAYSEEELAQGLKARREKLLDYLKTSKYLFITIGSAFGYMEESSTKIVANCHKMPATIFKKKLTENYLMIDSWIRTLNQVQALNPKMQVVFTVSPVRHVKDGLIENNRSKARLLELVSALESLRNVHYFPAYEIVIDELRDYRFYKSDNIHPNEQSVKYVWNRLKTVLFSKKTQLLCDQIESLRKLEKHQSIHAESEESVRFKKNTKDKINNLISVNPKIIWHKKA